MTELLERLRQWWKAASTPVPFEVSCSCGTPVGGVRHARHQVIPCPRCGLALFILPRSALPTLTAGPDEPDPVQLPHRSRRLPSLPRLLLFLGLATATFAIAYRVLHSMGESPERLSPVDAHDLQARWAEGRRALEAGSFQLAITELRAVSAIVAAGEAGPVPAAERRRLKNQLQQALLLADLSPHSLGEIAAWARTYNDEREWHAVFERSHRGKTVVFDATMRRDASGTFHLDYQVAANPERVQIDLGEVRLLRALPLQQPRRLLFGVRLASVQRVPPGVWMVRFEPDSGVLLTEARAVDAAFLHAADLDLTEVLQRQRGWSEELP